MASVQETFQVRGIRCERCVARLGHVLKDHDGLESANATLAGQVTLVWDDEQSPRETRCRGHGTRRLPRAAAGLAAGRSRAARESRRKRRRSTHC